MPRLILRFVAICAAILWVSSIPATPGADLVRADDQWQAADRVELAWTIPSTLYVHYTVVAQQVLPPKLPISGEDKAAGAGRGYNGFFAHEVDVQGVYLRRCEPLVLDEMMMQLCMYVPTGKQKVGGNWEREWKFERVQEFNSFGMTSSYLLKGQEDYADTKCWVLTGKHAMKPLEGDLAAQPSKLGALEIESTAWFDADRGFLRGAKVVVHGAMQMPKPLDKPAGYTNFHDWECEWRHTRDFDATEERILNGRVERAIALGVERLWKQRDAKGLWPYSTHLRGGTALSLLALLMCDVPAEDERIVESFNALKEQPLEIIYDVGLSIMALEARYITLEEKRSFLSSDKPVQLKRDLSAEDRTEMERLVKWVCDNQNTENAFWDYRKGFTPTIAGRFDFSCTQYALLGLAAAQRCNVRIPPGLIRKLVDQVRDYQCATGPKIKRIINYQPNKDPSKKGKSSYSTKTVEARGWAYSAKPTWDKYQDTTTAYGSMSASGVTCLMVGLDVAASMNADDFKAEFGTKPIYQKWEQVTQEAVESGLAWMEVWLSVTRNPVYYRNWYYYWMYGLERVGMLSGAKYFGEHNWYYEGCCPLLALQDKEGGWGAATDTSFALLFLKKGTVPPRKKVFTGDK
ncbi:MAG: hypothetical protein IPP14_01570 [Planctomycetes bacterium]|nr:hypothetical protein [Planctomycetota bacterium]